MTPKENYRRRVSNFRAALTEGGVDAVLLVNFWAETAQGGDYNLYYISNLLDRYMQCFLVLTQKECVLWVENDDQARAKEQSPVSNIEPMGVGENWGFTADEFGHIAANAIRRLTGKPNARVGISGRFLPGSVALALLREGLDLVEVGRSLEISRIVKDPDELELVRKGAYLADLGVQAVMDATKEGITEFELTVLAEAEMRRNGAECFWWKSLVAAGPDAEKWPDAPSQRKIARGDLVLMDFTPVIRGYGGDIARSFVFGTPTPPQGDAFRIGERSLQAGVDLLRPGATCREMMAAAAEVVAGTHYEPFFIGVGHGIGLYNDNYPNFLAPVSKMNSLPEAALSWKMLPGMIVAMEIILTIPGIGGVRLEDNYLVTTDGAEKLTHAPVRLSID